MSKSKLTDAQKSKIAADLGINIGPDATSRENGLITKYLTDQGLHHLPEDE